MADGRFAPSPTGPLHFGSLVAAVASYLQADRWHLRVEDLDPPREVAGAAADQLRTLERFGFEWAGPVVYQSARHDAYAGAFDALDRAGHLFPCGCTRSEIADHGLKGVEGPAYPGTCRGGIADGKEPRAWRVRTDSEPIEFVDAIQGLVSQRVERDVGDFVVKRMDGTWAYQLAVVVDDAASAITEVVRGADLIESTPRQIHLQRLLGLPTPAYVHIPVAVAADGEKLSKSEGAAALMTGAEATDLARALAFLGHAPPGGLGLADLWAWAKANWDVACVPRRRTGTLAT